MTDDRGESRVHVWLPLAGIALLAALLLLGTCTPAHAQAPGDAERLAWIHAHHPQCCDHRDCRPATATMTVTGWRVEGADNVIPFAQVIRWPFAVPYACVIGGRARCLFMDAGG